MHKPTRNLFKLSKGLHKYIGLTGLIYFLLMAISGILLNHPDLIRGVSVPQWGVPSGFRHVNWDRMAMREVVFSTGERQVMFVGGRAGVWQSRDGGRRFQALNDGFPSSAYDRDTFCLLLTESSPSAFLYAGTRSGLYRYDFQHARWQAIDQARFQDVEIVDLTQRGDQILVWTANGCYALKGSEAAPALHSIDLRSTAQPPRRVPLTRFLLRLHDGTVLGLSGKLAVDGVGLLLVFLCGSAIFIWFIPWRKKHTKKRISGGRLFRALHKYHLKLGIWATILLVTIALTGVFIRPPFRQTIAGSNVSAGWLGTAQPAANGWERIDRAVYLPEDDSLLVATRNGFFKGPADFSGPFERLPIKVPVGGMGLNVLENLTHGRLLIGSFKGLYVLNEAMNEITDISGKPITGSHGHTKTTDRAVGAAVRNGELLFWADYREGLKMARTDIPEPVMPPEIETHAGLSLWHFLFLVHNGRIFQDWVGGYTWLIIPVGGLMLVISALSGSYDWLYRKSGWRGRKRSQPPAATAPISIPMEE